MPAPTLTTWSERMAGSMLRLKPVLSEKWDYDWGVTLSGVERVWLRTRNPVLFDYIKRNIDRFVEPDGSMPKYHLEEYNLDRINTGKLFFTLFDQTGDERYLKGLHLLRRQLDTQPRNKRGGFWHKAIYPYQMWLDGLYMAGPFYARYAVRFERPQDFDDIAWQFILMEQVARDSESGLLYHGWDESRQQRWAHPRTGCSPHFWGRALGWFAMALVDVLEIFPADHAKRSEVNAVLQRLQRAVEQVQHPASGLWYQVLDKGGQPGNYLEASASCMYTYALAKAARLGLLPAAAQVTARRAWEGILREFMRVGEDGLVYLEKTCGVAGLGGDPYRDGSYAYYVGEKQVTNDPKGVGAFLLAAEEMEA